MITLDIIITFVLGALGYAIRGWFGGQLLKCLFWMIRILFFDAEKHATHKARLRGN